MNQKTYTIRWEDDDGWHTSIIPGDKLRALAESENMTIEEFMDRFSDDMPTILTTADTLH
jgi:uncharacterized protein YeaO (DUF488 family)